ncbi:hypothetical protein GQ600_17081 [Phytophthora cactorum]|nr:hypothetical protein GQ600_17081 [Phytophthora cactorum]
MRICKWRLITDGTVEGRNDAGDLSRDPPLQMTQTMNQLTWEMTPQPLQEWDETLVRDKHVLRSLKKQPLHEARKPLRSNWQTGTGSLVDPWTRGTPTQFWARDGMLTALQRWVIYRVAVHQLNLHYPGKQYPRICQFEDEHDPRKLHRYTYSGRALERKRGRAALSRPRDWRDRAWECAKRQPDADNEEKVETAIRQVGSRPRKPA